MRKRTCEYCDYEGFESNEDLLLNKIDLGMLGEVSATAWLSCNKNDVKRGVIPRLCMDTGIITEDEDEVVNRIVSIPIRFCPVCGRNLTEGHDILPEFKLELYKLYKDGEIATILFNSLVRSGFHHLEELSYIREKDAKTIRCLGARSLDNLKKCMTNHGIEFNDENVLLDILSSLRKGDKFSFIPEVEKGRQYYRARGVVFDHIEGRDWFKAFPRYVYFRKDDDAPVKHKFFSVREVLSIEKE